MPKLASAGGTASAKISSLLPSSSGVNAAETPPLERNRQRIESDYGLPVELQKELLGLTLKAMVSENMVGADSEALCCLRKGPAGLWGDWLFVRRLAELERSRRAEGGGGNREKLRVRAYFAEIDALRVRPTFQAPLACLTWNSMWVRSSGATGALGLQLEGRREPSQAPRAGTRDPLGDLPPARRKGQGYVEDCCKGSGGDEFRDVLEFTTTTVGETDHDSVVQSVEVLKQIFLDAGGSMPVSP